MTDVTDLITDDHAQILGLFAALDELARRDYPAEADLTELWDRLASLLESHLQAEEEICYPAMAPAIARDDLLRDLTADREDICEALAETRLHQPGSITWWRAVTDARAAARRHIRAGTRQLLPALGHTTAQQRGTLGQQWAAYTAAQLHDSPHAATATSLHHTPGGRP